MAVGTGRERELLRLLPRLLDAATESIVAIDPTGSVTYANAAAERMYGWDAGERPTSCPVAAAIAEDPAGVAQPAHGAGA